MKRPLLSQVREPMSGHWSRPNFRNWRIPADGG
jgi:hypothetical protein